MKLLLHICCGPCSLYVIDHLRNNMDNVPENVEITGYYYNPNIHPYDEIIKRSVNAKVACDFKGIPLVSDLSYNIAPWKNFPGTSGQRCVMCYKERFEKTAEYAKANGYTHFTSTLFVSPYQNHEAMLKEAKAAADKYGVAFLEGSDFTVGFREGQQQARELGLYRQKYCGCIRSLKGE